MGIFDSLFNPTKNTEKMYGQARQDFTRTRGMTDPFYSQLLGSGTSSNRLLADLLGANGPDAQRQAFADFQTSPAYEFNLAEGTRAIDNSAAARGMGQSGTNLKALQEYGQGLYSNEFNNRISQLSGLAGQGLAGAGGLTNNSTNYGNLLISQGQAQDAGNAAGMGNLLSLAGLFTGTTGGLPTGRLF